jgi:DNA-directed RNA polymerase subunit RPC12/RpoP
MTEYNCFDCNKKIPSNLIKRKTRCPYCGSKILFKPRVHGTKVKAR